MSTSHDRHRQGRGPSPDSAATQVRERVLAGGERYWSLSDFRGLSAGAVAHALSRLAAEGVLQRVRKGVYYRAKPTAIGPSMPSASGVVAYTAAAPLHPAGLTAAGELGLTTQNPGVPEFSTPAAGAPSALRDAKVRTRRPAARAGLDAQDAALLELLRDRARTSDLSPQRTIRRLLGMLSDPARFRRLADVAMTEPPRVRAMLGALGEEAGAPEAAVRDLRESLNPLTRFDFGALGDLPNARAWNAR